MKEIPHSDPVAKGADQVIMTIPICIGQLTEDDISRAKYHKKAKCMCFHKLKNPISWEPVGGCASMLE